jgi:hypothetical protein
MVRKHKLNSRDANTGGRPPLQQQEVTRRMSDHSASSHEPGALGEAMTTGRRSVIVHVRPGYHEAPPDPANSAQAKDVPRPLKRPIQPKNEE